MRRVITISLALAVFGFAGAQALGGDTCTFTASVGVWGSSLNWENCSGTIPGAGDEAVIPSGKVCSVENASQSVAVLDVVGTLNIIGSRSLTMDENSQGASTIDGHPALSRRQPKSRPHRLEVLDRCARLRPSSHRVA